jgi:type IV pilus assembly protein PilM
MATPSVTLNLDISPSGARFLALSKSGDGYVVNFGAAIDESAVNKGHVQDLLKRFAGAPAGASKFVATSIWASAIFVRPITMPLMTPSELKGAIQFEAEKHLPFPVDACVLDYYLIRKSGGKNMEVMLVAAKKDLVEERRKMMEEAGYSLSFIDIHPFAVSNAFSVFQPDYKTKCIAFVHIGDMTGGGFIGANVVNVMKDGMPVMVRDLGQEAAAGGAIAQEVVDRLVGKIGNSLTFYENSTDEEIEDVYLTGAGARSAELLAAMGKTLERKVAKWSFMDRLKFESKEAQDAVQQREGDFTVCLGLGLRGLKA